MAENRLVWFLLRANRGQDRGGSDKDKGENGGGGEGKGVCMCLEGFDYLVLDLKRYGRGRREEEVDVIIFFRGMKNKF